MKQLDFEPPTIPAHIMDWGVSTDPAHWMSQRPCPKCNCRHMATDGKGNFRCNVCGYQDMQDVGKYKHLAYEVKRKSTWGHWSKKKKHCAS